MKRNIKYTNAKLNFVFLFVKWHFGFRNKMVAIYLEYNCYYFQWSWEKSFLFLYAISNPQLCRFCSWQRFRLLVIFHCSIHSGFSMLHQNIFLCFVIALSWCYNFFLTAPVARGGSWSRGWKRTTLVTWDAAVMMPDP